MTTEKEQLKAEIAKRDARIAELEADANKAENRGFIRGLRAENMAAAALKAQQPSSGVVDEQAAFEEWYRDYANSSRNVLKGDCMDAWQARARLDQPTASAGVVLPERAVKDGGKFSTELKVTGWNACLDEVARLNPCCAQAVPGWTEAVEACAKLCEERAAYYESGDDDAPGSRRGNACRHCADVIRYNLAAAPSAKKESGDE